CTKAAWACAHGQGCASREELGHDLETTRAAKAVSGAAERGLGPSTAGCRALRWRACDPDRALPANPERCRGGGVVKHSTDAGVPPGLTGGAQPASAAPNGGVPMMGLDTPAGERPLRHALLLHGVGGSARIWSPQHFPLRAAGLEPIALDLPGYGGRPLPQ